MNIRWITEFLGTAPALDVQKTHDTAVVDVRDLVDKTGNPKELVEKKIQEGIKYIQNGQKTIVCCDYGISRSNAVAAGILAIIEGISFTESVRKVQKQTGESEIKLAPLDIVREVIEDLIPNNRIQKSSSILITGASGFIGRELIKALSDKYSLITPSKDILDLENGSTKLSLFVADHNVESIIHLANPRIYTSNIALGKTLTMLRNIIEVCLSNHLTLIYPSCWEVYSGYSGHLFADESTPLYAKGPYGDTKFLAEILLNKHQLINGLRCAILRSSPLYGQGTDKPKFIYNFIDKAQKNEKIVTHKYLNSDPALDLLHVNDFVDAISKVYEKKYLGTLNLGTGILTSTKAIAELIKRELRSNSMIEQARIDVNTASISMNYAKAKELLGWEPRTSLEDGLKNILSQNFKNNTGDEQE